MFTLIFFLANIACIRVCLVTGRPGQAPNTICSDCGGQGIMATTRNLPYLIQMLRASETPAAVVTGWNGVEANLVVRDNGAVAPYDPRTNNANAAFCCVSGMPGPIPPQPCPNPCPAPLPICPPAPCVPYPCNTGPDYNNFVPNGDVSVACNWDKPGNAEFKSPCLPYANSPRLIECNGNWNERRRWPQPYPVYNINYNYYYLCDYDKCKYPEPCYDKKPPYKKKCPFLRKLSNCLECRPNEKCFGEATYCDPCQGKRCKIKVRGENYGRDCYRRSCDDPCRRDFDYDDCCRERPSFCCPRQDNVGSYDRNNSERPFPVPYYKPGDLSGGCETNRVGYEARGIEEAEKVDDVKVESEGADSW